MLKEFREFAIKGNALDLAVGVIIGAAFGKIVESVVNDLIMPIVASLVGKPDFSDIMIPLSAVPAGTAATYAAYKEAGVNFIGIGSFITILFNFLILAWIVFLIVKAVNGMKRAPAPVEAAPPPPPEDVLLLREIRDALKAR